MVAALDETNTKRFLPTYLAKCPPPRDVTDPMTIARMVHCITFQNDQVTPARKPAREPAREPAHEPSRPPSSPRDRSSGRTWCAWQHQQQKPGKGTGGRPDELWSSPNYFMDIKKGASEDHAILQAPHEHFSLHSRHEEFCRLGDG